MQPYFAPYIGYFQLINSVDVFVLYDNIEYTKKGWINRNRILLNGKDEYVSLPLKKDSDFLHVNQRFLADSYLTDKIRIQNKLSEIYKKAPHFIDSFPLVQSILNFENSNLFDFLKNSIQLILSYLDIKTSIINSSDLKINHDLKSESKVIEICQVLKSDTYINPIGGITLYSSENFLSHNINLRFLKSDSIQYSQFKNEFVPWLSIIDLLMFNSKQEIQNFLKKCEIIQGL